MMVLLIIFLFDGRVSKQIQETQKLTDPEHWYIGNVAVK
jgi:hypothetical protein